MRGYSGSKTLDFIAGVAILGIGFVAFVQAQVENQGFWVYVLILGILACGFVLLCSTVESKR